MRKKIVHVIGSLDVGGAEVMLRKLLSRMDRNRFVPSVISLINSGTTDQCLRSLDIPVYTIGMKAGRPTPAALWRLARQIRQLEPQLVQTWMYHSNLAAQLAITLTNLKTPVVWNIRGSHFVLKGEKLLTGTTIWLGAKLSGLPTKIVNNSLASAQGHEQQLGYREDKRVIIPNGFDTSVFAPSPEARASVRAELGLDGNALLIGLMARYHPMKDHANFLRAASLLAQKHSNVHFVLAGNEVDLTNVALAQSISSLKLSSQVHLLGHRSDVPQLSAAMDLVSLPSAYGEGFPNTIGEAMACGVPCVVTDVGDSAFLVGETGRVVPSRNPEALAAAWQELIEMNEEQRHELGSQARQRVIEKFSLDSIARQYEALYEEVIRNREESRETNVRHSWVH